MGTTAACGASRRTRRGRLLARVDAALRYLSKHSGDRRARVKAYHEVAPGVWMPVRTRDEDRLILGLPGPGEDEITVVYVGPAP